MYAKRERMGYLCNEIRNESRDEQVRYRGGGRRLLYLGVRIMCPVLLQERASKPGPADSSLVCFVFQVVLKLSYGTVPLRHNPATTNKQMPLKAPNQ